MMLRISNNELSLPENKNGKIFIMWLFKDVRLKTVKTKYSSTCPSSPKAIRPNLVGLCPI